MKPTRLQPTKCQQLVMMLKNKPSCLFDKSGRPQRVPLFYAPSLSKPGADMPPQSS